jgi:hypothetical protein
MVRRAAVAAIAVCAAAVWSLPAAARPHLSCPPGKAPDWAQLSDGGGFSDFHTVGVGLPPGTVTLSCVAGADGRLYDCEVADENPASEGLGLWALHVSRDFRLQRPGCPPNGARFNIPLRFVRSG